MHYDKHKWSYWLYNPIILKTRGTQWGKYKYDEKKCQEKRRLASKDTFSRPSLLLRIACTKENKYPLQASSCIACVWRTERTVNYFWNSLLKCGNVRHEHGGQKRDYPRTNQILALPSANQRGTNRCSKLWKEFKGGGTKTDKPTSIGKCKFLVV